MLEPTTWQAQTACLLGLLAALISGPAKAQAPDYGEAEAEYRAMLTRPSLSRRIEGRHVLATTGDARAFAILSQHCREPDEPQQFVRSLLVTLLADSCQGAPPIEAWRQWRTSDADLLAKIAKVAHGTTVQIGKQGNK